MSSILVSSQSYAEGGTIARRAAEALGFRLVESELFRLTSERFDVPRPEIRDALCSPPSLFGMSDDKRKRLAALVQAQLSAMLVDDELVYHGPFAHALVAGVSHILTVGVTASNEQRCNNAVKREGYGWRKAERRIAADDRATIAIGRILFPKADQNSIDLKLDASDNDVESAADKIVHAAKASRYEAMTYSKKLMREIALSHQLRSLIVDLDANAAVDVHGTTATVRAVSLARKRAAAQAKIVERLQGVNGIEDLQVKVFDADFTAFGRR